MQMQQRVIIRGEKLVGVLHHTGSQKLVVLCHGALCTKEHPIMMNLAAALENEGISAFLFDFSGNGESEGTFYPHNIENEADDLRYVVDYFNRLNRTTVVVLGHSKGGDDVLVYASKYHDIPAVVNVSGRYDLTRGFDKGFRKNIWERFVKDGYIDVKTETGDGYIDIREACLAIDENCRVLTVHGSEDEFNPIQDAIEFSKIIPNHRLIIIQGANHAYTSHQAELVSSVLPFVKECMQCKVNNSCARFWLNIIDFSLKILCCSAISDACS